MILRQLFWFAVSGVLGLLVDLGVLWLAKPWLGLYGGRALSFLCAVSTTWAFNRHQTFQATGRRGRRMLAEYIAYLGSMGVGGVINYGAYVLFVQHFPTLPQVALLGVAVGSLAGMGFNFASARWLIFRQQRR